MILVARNIRYMQICAGGSIGEGASRVKCKRLADVGTCHCGLLATHWLRS